MVERISKNYVSQTAALPCFTRLVYVDPCTGGSKQAITVDVRNQSTLSLRHADRRERSPRSLNRKLWLVLLEQVEVLTGILTKSDQNHRRYNFEIQNTQKSWSRTTNTSPWQQSF